jgi:hypothetical protein
MAPRVNEVRALVRLLDPGNESPEEAAELARELIQELDRQRSSLLGWSLVHQLGPEADGSLYVTSYGPYGTERAARDAAQLHGPSWPAGGRLLVAPARTPEYLTEVRLRADVNAALAIPSEKERVRALADALGVTQKLVREAIDKAAEKARPSTDYVRLLTELVRQMSDR